MSDSYHMNPLANKLDDCSYQSSRTLIKSFKKLTWIGIAMVLTNISMIIFFHSCDVKYG